MVVGIAIIVLFRKDNLTGLDGVVDGLQVLGIEVFAVIDTTKVLCKIFQLHSLVPLEVGVMLVSVQHNNGVCKHKDRILVGDLLRLCRVVVFLGEICDDPLDQRRLTREAEGVQKQSQRFIESQPSEVEQLHESLQNGFVIAFRKELAQYLLVDSSRALDKLGDSFGVVGV